MCCSRSALPVLAAVTLLGSLSAGHTQEVGSRPWLLSAAAQVDDDGSSGYGLGLDWGVTETTWLSFYGGLSHSPDDRADVTTRTLVAGLDQRLGPMGFTLGLESWGEPDEVESRDVTGSLYLRGDRYRLALKGERRDIDVTFTLTGPEGEQLRRTADLTADGFGASFSVALSERWRLSADGMGYDYSRDLSLLPRLQTFDFLASSVLTLSNSFIDSEWGVALDYQLGEPAFSVQWRRDRSAVDLSELTSVSLGALFPVADRLDLEISLGVSDSDELDAALFGGVYLFFYGGG